MVQRICSKCNAVFDRKYCYDRHINKKFNCNQNIDKINDENDIFSNFPNFSISYPNFSKSFQIFPNENLQMNDNNKSNDDYNIKNSIYNCNYCLRSYTLKGNLVKHLKVCKIKKENDNEKETIFKLLLEKDKQHQEELKQHKEEVYELKKQNKILMDKIDKLINMNSYSTQAKIINTNNQTNSNNLINNQTNSNNTITNNQTNQNNFIMVNFGKEDLSIIDEKLFIDRIIKKPTISGVKIPDEVLKIIHFNPQYPQLSNIYISDINREKCMVYEDNEWKLSNIDNIPQIIDKVCVFSTDQINILKNKHPDNKLLQDRLKTIEKYNNMIHDDFIEDLKENIDNNILIKKCEDFQKHTYNTLKKTLYNEGKKIKKNIKLK